MEGDSVAGRIHSSAPNTNQMTAKCLFGPPIVGERGHGHVTGLVCGACDYKMTSVSA